MLVIRKSKFKDFPKNDLIGTTEIDFFLKKSIGSPGFWTDDKDVVDVEKTPRPKSREKKTAKRKSDSKLCTNCHTKSFRGPNCHGK